MTVHIFDLYSPGPQGPPDPKSEPDLPDGACGPFFWKIFNFYPPASVTPEILSNIFRELAERQPALFSTVTTQAHHTELCPLIAKMSENMSIV